MDRNPRKKTVSVYIHSESRVKSLWRWNKSLLCWFFHACWGNSPSDSFKYITTSEKAVLLTLQPVIHLLTNIYSHEEVKAWDKFWPVPVAIYRPDDPVQFNLLLFLLFACMVQDCGFFKAVCMNKKNTACHFILLSIYSKCMLTHFAHTRVFICMLMSCRSSLWPNNTLLQFLCSPTVKKTAFVSLPSLCTGVLW